MAVPATKVQHSDDEVNYHHSSISIHPRADLPRGKWDQLPLLKKNYIFNPQKNYIFTSLEEKKYYFDPTGKKDYTIILKFYDFNLTKLIF